MQKFAYSARKVHETAIIYFGPHSSFYGIEANKTRYDLGNRKGVINHLLFMYDIKLYGKNENQVDDLVTDCANFQQRFWNGIRC